VRNLQEMVSLVTDGQYAMAYERGMSAWLTTAVQHYLTPASGVSSVRWLLRDETATGEGLRNPHSSRRHVYQWRELQMNEYSGSQRVKPVQRGHESDNLRRRLSEALDSGQQPKHEADGERSHVSLSKYESEPKAAGNTRDIADISDAERWPTAYTAVPICKEPMPSEKRFTGPSVEFDEGDVNRPK